MRFRTGASTKHSDGKCAESRKGPEFSGPSLFLPGHQGRSRLGVGGSTGGSGGV